MARFSTEKCTVVYRCVGDVVRIEEEDCPRFVDDVSAFMAFIEQSSKERFRGYEELEALEWHRGGKPSNWNLVASFNRRNLGLFDYANPCFTGV